MNYQVSDDVPDPDWLFSESSGTIGAGESTELPLLMDTSNLTPGEHRATMTIIAEGAQNSPATVEFTLIINSKDTSDPAVLNVSPSRLEIIGAIDRPIDAQSFAIQNSGGTALSWSAEANVEWLTLSTNSGTLRPEERLFVEVSVSLSKLSVGTRKGVITITAPGAQNSPVTVAVSLTVTEQLDPPVLKVATENLSFMGQAEGANPPSQRVKIENAGGSSMNWQVSTDTNWLQVRPNKGILQSEQSTMVTVSASLATLSEGTKQGAITIVAEGADNSPVRVPVTFEVEPAGPRTFRVPGEVSTLEQAVERARDGDTIEIASGTYRDVALSIKKSLSIRGGAGTVTLQGNGEDPVISADINGVLIENVVIREGDIGVWVTGTAQVSIENSTITDNSRVGIFVDENADVTVKGNVIQDTRSVEGALGEGIFVADDAKVVIENNTISNNLVVGVFFADQSSGTISANTISNTKANPNGTSGRGIIIFDDAEVLIEDNTIAENMGTGVFATDNSIVTLRGNSISNTQPNTENAFGRGIGLQDSVQAMLENNVIQDNAEAGIAMGDDVQATIFSNTITGNGEEGVIIGFITDNETAQAEISDNIIKDNVNCGIQVSSDEPQIRVTGSDNQLSGNNPNICDSGGKLPQNFALLVSISGQTVFEDDFSNPADWKIDRAWTFSDDEQYRLFLSNRNTINSSPIPEFRVRSLKQFCYEVDIKLLAHLTQRGERRLRLRDERQRTFRIVQ